MKKIFAFAVLFAAVSMVACGGEQKKAEDAEEKATTECCAEKEACCEECCAEKEACCEECCAEEACCGECPEGKECCGECAEAEPCCEGECCAK